MFGVGRMNSWSGHCAFFTRLQRGAVGFFGLLGCLALRQPGSAAINANRYGSPYRRSPRATPCRVAPTGVFAESFTVDGPSRRGAQFFRCVGPIQDRRLGTSKAHCPPRFVSAARGASRREARSGCDGGWRALDFVSIFKNFVPQRTRPSCRFMRTNARNPEALIPCPSGRE